MKIRVFKVKNEITAKVSVPSQSRYSLHFYGCSCWTSPHSHHRACAYSNSLIPHKELGSIFIPNYDIEGRKKNEDFIAFLGILAKEIKNKKYYEDFKDKTKLVKLHFLAHELFYNLMESQND